MEEMQKMTVEQADQLSDALETMNRASEEYCDMVKSVFPQTMRNIAVNKLHNAFDRYLYYIKRYNDAWFVTRWWWNIKMNKAKVELDKVEKFAEEMKNQGLFEPIK